MSELDPVTFLIVTELLTVHTVPPFFGNLPSLAAHDQLANSDSVRRRRRKSPGWSDSLEDLSLRPQRDFGADSVQVAYLHSTPHLSDVVENLLSRRIHRFRILPLFLSEGELASDDIPLEIHDLKRNMPRSKSNCFPLW